MSEGLDLGGGEQSPPMPEIPAFLRRYRQEDAVVSNVLSTGARIDPPESPPNNPVLDAMPETTQAEVQGEGIGKTGEADSPTGAIPTEEEILSTIRKLAEKRNKIDSTILGLKELLIAKVRQI